jgi:hypothetical protein
MGMIGCFVAVSEDTLRNLRSDEDSIEEFLYPDDGDSEPENYVDVDKAWHGIHYLLTGESGSGQEPLSLAIFGGTEFGPEVGIGPARFLTSIQVTELANALDAIPVETLAARFNPKDMEQKEIYPDVIWVRDNMESLDYLLENYQQLLSFYKDAAGRGDAVIQWMS